MSRLDTFQQIIAFLLILLGSHLWVAACVVNLQRAMLARKIHRRCLAEMEKTRERELQIGLSGKVPGGKGVEKQGVAEETVAAGAAPPLPPILLASPDKIALSSRCSSAVSLSSQQGSTIVHFPADSKSAAPSNGNGNDNDSDGHPCDEAAQRERDTLSALTTLSWLLPAYLVSFQVLGTVAIGSWVARRAPDIVAANALSPWWFAAFNAVSAFNNSGMSLLDANMVPFATRGSFVVWVQGLLILAGNSAFPIFLKAIVALLPSTGAAAAGTALLRDERRGRKLFPYLFGRRETGWLVAMLVALNAIDWAAFAASAPFTPALQPLSAPRMQLAGLFQALCVRSGGFAIVSIRDLHTAVLLAYTVMLYLSAFPIDLPPRANSGPESTLRFVAHQLRGLMRAGDLRYLAAAVWLVCVIDGIPLGGVFAVVFEIASAFGCVGVSFGSNANGAMARVADWRGASKLVTASVMLWGRFRELRRGILMCWGQTEEPGVAAF